MSDRLQENVGLSTRPRSIQIYIPLRNPRNEADACVAAPNSLDGLKNAVQHVQ